MALQKRRFAAVKKPQYFLLTLGNGRNPGTRDRALQAPGIVMSVARPGFTGIGCVAQRPEALPSA